MFLDDFHAVAEQRRHLFQRDASQEKFHGKCVSESMGVPARDLDAHADRREHSLKVPDPCLWLRSTTPEVVVTVCRKSLKSVACGEVLVVPRCPKFTQCLEV